MDKGLHDSTATVGAALREMFSLEGQNVLVTGAARGLGWAMAQAAARAGAHVILNDLDAETLRPRVAELEGAGLASSSAAFDITSAEEVERGVGEIARQWGPIDVLVNNAGVQQRKPFVDYTPAEWDRIFDTHVRGSFLVTQAVVRQMLPRRRGRIIMIGSIAVLGIRGTIVPYAGAKGALTSMVRALATELGPSGITCNAIAPGFMATDFTRTLVDDAEFTRFVEQRVPSGRWGDPADIGPAIVYLASQAGSFVNGSVLTIDGGLLAAV